MFGNFAEVYFCLEEAENKCDYNQSALAPAKILFFQMKLFITCICIQFTTASGPAETILRRMHSELKQSIIRYILISL